MSPERSHDAATVDVSPHALVGRTIGHYAITAMVGAGGMGAVYRARDMKLGREVAIKILPPTSLSDPDRRARFDREARVLATLNHPNIAQVYGVEESHPAIVMELVEGETLADRVARSATRGSPHGLPIAEVLSVARQIADALDAAHEKGIVHRDLKPANVAITPDGRVKVLDFGLAKLTDADGAVPEQTHSPTMTVGGTRDGMLLGTAAYMSPEQARGFAVDKRTDIWAFGCVLYEMLTGRAPFLGETVSDTIARILEREPDWAALPAATPPAVRRILARSLEKDLRRRLRDVGDTRADLEDAAAEREGVVRAPGTARAANRRVVLAGIAALLGIGAIAIVWAWAARRAPQDLDPPPATSVERMTFDSSFTTMPALSPDGRLLAYASDRSGNLDIWVQQTVGGAPLRLTDDPADDTAPEFSPDGSQIAFRSDRQGGGIFVAPALGGPARLTVPEGRGPRFSPDGSRIAYWKGTFRGTPSGGRSELFVLTLNGGTSVQLLRGFSGARDPVWSPDGRGVVAFGRRDRSSPMDSSVDWWWVPLDGTTPVKTGVFELPAVRTMLGPHRPSPDVEPMPLSWTAAGVLFSDGLNLWSIPMSTATGKPTGAPRPVTFGTGAYRNAGVARDGTIVFDAWSSARVVQRAPLTGAGDSDTGGADELLVDGQQGAGRASTTRDGNVIAFERVVRGRIEIWTRHVRTGREQLITSVESTSITSATISQDGSRIAYTVTDGTGFPATGFLGRGYVIETTGGVPRALCSACNLHGFLLDHRRVLAIDNGRALRLIDSTTAAVDDLVTVDRGQLGRPHASADDRWLAFTYLDTTDATPIKSYVVPITPGHPVPRDRWQRVEEPTTTGRPAGWALNAPVLYLLLDTDGFRCLWAQRVDPASGRLVAAPTPAKHFHREQVATAAGVSTSFGNAVSEPGFVYETIAQRSDLWRLSPRNETR